MVALERTKCIRHRYDDHEDRSVSQHAEADETSTLLPASDTDDTHIIGRADNGEAAEPSLSIWRLILLCLGMIGLQLAWAAELSNGSPFLLSLGMSKSLLAIVWIAGPLAGVLVQPVVGIWSDACQISWGRRRPFLVGGAAATVVALLSLSWTIDIVQGIVRLFGGDPHSKTTVLGTQAFAVFWIYVLDIGVNVIQAALRAFIVDIAPAHQQDAANAWASRLQGVANITGYLMSFSHLPKILPWLGNTQLKVLTAIGSASLILTIGISTATTVEKNPKIYWPATTSTSGRVISFLKTSFTAFSRLPDQTRRVCFAQFFNWMGWFPFLFYISTYIGQLYVNPLLEQNPNASKDEIDEMWDAGTRLGSFALLTFAITSFAGNSFLPFIIQPLSATRVPASRLERLLSHLRIPGLTIRRAWILSHIFFAICMWSTLFIKTPPAGAVMTGVVGISWSMTNWAPFTLIAADISQRDREKRRSGVPAAGVMSHGSVSSQSPKQDQDIDQAGVVLGLHNVAVSAPQIVATLVASVIFHFSQKDRGVANDESIAHVLRFSGLVALVAAWATARIG